MERKYIIIFSTILCVILLILVGKGIMENTKKEENSSEFSNTIKKTNLPANTPVVQQNETKKKKTSKPSSKPTSRPTTKPTTKPSNKPTNKSTDKPKEKSEKKSVYDSKKKKATKKPVEKTPTKVPANKDDIKKVYLSISCEKILDKRELWKDGVEEIIPKNGIFANESVVLEKKMTVYDLIKQVCLKNNIPLDAVYTPIYGTYYIKGVGNLYEFDCGEESGWKYSVNGKIPSMGSSSYELENSDKVCLFYDYKY